MNEIWKDVVGYEGLYRVSESGSIYSIKSGKIMKPCNDVRGYARVILRKDKKSAGCLIHRMVAMAFIPNPQNYPEVNHKDENPRNNQLSNLEWCTYKYNNTYGTRIQRCMMHTDYKSIALKNSILVAQYSLDGQLITTWQSANECSRKCGYDNSSIARCCRGEINTSYGYIWKYISGEHTHRQTKCLEV